MKIYIKKYLLQEGIIGDHWGKIAIAGIAAAAAHAGVMGPEAQKNIDQGGANFKGFLDKMGDKAGQMNNFYKKDIEAGKDHLSNGVDHAKEIGHNIIDKSKEIGHNITNQHSSTNLSNADNAANQHDINSSTLNNEHGVLDKIGSMIGKNNE
jgi:hypothetical protein